MIIEALLVVIIGFAGGIAVGGGLVAFISVLGIVPRLTQVTKTKKFIQYYQWSIILGAVCSSWLSLRENVLELHIFWVIPIGLAAGIFVGMLAAALTEVLNVLPILSKRIGVVDRIIYLLMAIVFGKVFGSLFHWLYFVNL